MTTEIKYCKHCGKPYHYQASGCGCLEPVNDKKYCPECMSVILAALKTIPKKVVHKYKEISCGIDYKKELLPLKEKYEQELKNKNSWFDVTSLECAIESKTTYAEKYYYNGYEYRVEFDKNKNITIYVLAEYYLQTNEWGNWIRTNERENIYVPLSMLEQMVNQLKEATAKPMKPFKPIDWDFEWDVILKKC